MHVWKRKIIIMLVVLLTGVPMSKNGGIVQALAVCPGENTQSNLVSYWSMDNDADDDFGSNDGTVNNGATFVSGKVNEAVDFDGINDFIQIPDSASMRVADGSFTIAAWVNPDASQVANADLLGTETSISSQKGWNIRVRDDLVVNTNIHDGSTRVFDFYQDLIDSRWTHIAVTVDRSAEELKQYINGRLVGTADTTGQGGYEKNVGLKIGAAEEPGTGRYYAGLVDEVYLYSAALTAAEVKTMYTNSSGGCQYLTSVSDTMTRQAISTASNHTIEFTTAAGVEEGQTVTVTFPAGFNLSSITENDVDVSDDSVDLTTAADCTGSEEASVTVSGQDLIIELCEPDGGAIGSSSTVEIEIGTHASASGTGTNQITNPSSVGDYLIEIGSTFGDRGNMSVPIVDSDQATGDAEAAPSLTFDIDVGTAAGENSNSSIALGTLSTGSVTTSNNSSIESVFLELTSNAANGAIVTVKGENGGLFSSDTSNTITISDGGSATAISAGTEGFGLCVTDTNEDSGGPVAAVAPYNGTCDASNHNIGGLTTSPRTIINTSGEVVAGTANDTAEIMVKASISGATAAANDYTETITFVATGTY